MNKEAPKNEIEYGLSFFKKKYLIGVMAFTFLFGFFLYFPIFLKINNTVRTALASIPGCPISYDSIHFEFFLPKIVIKEAKIPRSCFNAFGPPISLENLKINFQGPAFSPFGVKLRADLLLQKLALNIHFVAGIFGENVVRLEKSTIKLDALNQFIPNIKLSGNLTTDFFLRLKGKTPTQMKLLATSKDLVIPSQTISAFKLPSLKANQFSIKGEMKNEKSLEIIELFLGDSLSPIRGKVKGDIKINPNNFNMSSLNLDSEVAFSETFLEDFSILKILMAKFTQKDSFHQIKIRGTIESPKFENAN